MSKSYLFVGHGVASFINLGFSELTEPAREPTRKEYDSIETSQCLALKELTLSIQPGEKVAICGRSGRYTHSSL